MSELEPEMYICSGCLKEKDYLSESWSTITWADGHKTYRCLECRSEKVVWPHGDVR